MPSENVGDGKMSQTPPVEASDPVQVAAYVCDMSKNLKKFTAAADLKFLTYLLDMVQIESMSVITSTKSDEANQAK